jgi:type II secretory pathway component PulM
MNNLTRFLNHLSLRQKNVLTYALIAAFFYLAFIFLINFSLAKTQKNLAGNVELLTLIKEKMPLLTLIKNSSNNKNVKNPNASIANIESSLAQAYLKSYVTSLTQNDVSEISLSFEHIPFNDFYAWLSNINKTMPINIKSTLISNQGKGLVNIDLTLEMVDY